MGQDNLQDARDVLSSTLQDCSCLRDLVNRSSSLEGQSVEDPSAIAGEMLVSTLPPTVKMVSIPVERVPEHTHALLEQLIHNDYDR